MFRLALPLVLEWVIPWAAERQAGARVEVDNIDLGLFAGTVMIEKLRVHLPEDPKAEAKPNAPDPDVEAAGETAPSSIERDGALFALEGLAVNLDWLPLLSGRVHLRSVRVVQPKVRLTQNPDGSLKLPAPTEPETELAAKPKPAVQADTHDGSHPPPAAEAEPDADDGWEIALDHFELTALHATLHTSAGVEVVQFGSARFALDDLSVGPEGIGLSDFALEEPQLYVQRNWLLDQSRGSAETAPADDDAGKAPAFALNHLAVRRADFTFRTARGPLAVSVQLEITEAGTARGHVFPVDLQLGLGEGSVALQGQVGVDPLFYEGRFAWKNLRMPPFLLLAVPDLVPWLQSCNAGGDFQVSFRADPDDAKTGISLSGNSQVSELSFRDPESGDLAIEWENFEIQIRSGFLPLESTVDSPGHVEFDRIALSGPRFVFTNPPDALEKLIALLEGRSPPEPGAAREQQDPEGEDSEREEIVVAEPLEEAEASRTPVPVARISQLEIRDGTLTYLDRSVSPPHETAVEKFHLDAAGFVSAPAVGLRSIKANGFVQKTGTLELRGSIPAGRGSLQFDLRHLELVPYDGFARSAGWRVERGATTLLSAIRVGANSYETNNQVVLHDLALVSAGDGKFTSTFGLSLDLALALLRDSNGDIELSIPVTWKKGELGIDVGTLVLSALKSALTGALAAPFKMIGALMPDDGKAASFEAIPLAAGTSELSPEAIERIAPLAELLAQRPTLGVALRGRTGPEDRPALAEALLREKALVGAEFPEAEKAGFFARRRVTRALVARSAGEPGLLEPEDQALLERYIDAQSVPEERFLALARLRSEAVRDEMVAAGAPIESTELQEPMSAETASVSVALQPRKSVIEEPAKIPDDS